MLLPDLTAMKLLQYSSIQCTIDIQASPYLCRGTPHRTFGSSSSISIRLCYLNQIRTHDADDFAL